MPYAVGLSGGSGLLIIAVVCVLFNASGKFISWGLDLLPDTPSSQIKARFLQNLLNMTLHELVLPGGFYGTAGQKSGKEHTLPSAPVWGPLLMGCVPVLCEAREQFKVRTALDSARGTLQPTHGATQGCGHDCVLVRSSGA